MVSGPGRGGGPGPGRWKEARMRSCHGDAKAVGVGRHGVSSKGLEELGTWCWPSMERRPDLEHEGGRGQI